MKTKLLFPRIKEVQGFTWFEKIGLFFCIKLIAVDLETFPSITTEYKIMFGRMYVYGQYVTTIPASFNQCKCLTDEIKFYQTKCVGVLSTQEDYYKGDFLNKKGYFLIKNKSDLIGRNCEKIIKLGNWNEIPVKTLDEIFDLVNAYKIPVE